MLKQLFKKKLGRLFGSTSAPARNPEAQLEVDRQCEALSLYNLQFCPYCLKVRMQIQALELKIALRNIDEAQWGNELMREGGKFQAPCLRIQDQTGEVHWLYESEDIITWLKQRFPLHPAKP
jgi:glutathione S-transferase